MLNELTKKLFAFSASHYRLFPVLAAALMFGLFFGLPDSAHADLLTNVTSGMSKLFFAAIVIILMVTGTIMLLQKHIMGMFVLVGAGILVLLIGNTDLIIQFAQTMAKLFGLKWGATSDGGAQ